MRGLAPHKSTMPRPRVPQRGAPQGKDGTCGALFPRRYPVSYCARPTYPLAAGTAQGPLASSALPLRFPRQEPPPDSPASEGLRPLAPSSFPGHAMGRHANDAALEAAAFALSSALGMAATYPLLTVAVRQQARQTDPAAASLACAQHRHPTLGAISSACASAPPTARPPNCPSACPCRKGPAPALRDLLLPTPGNRVGLPPPTRPHAAPHAPQAPQARARLSAPLLTALCAAQMPATVLASLRYIVAAEGASALYSGVGLAAFSLACGSLVYFFIYALLRDALLAASKCARLSAASAAVPCALHVCFRFHLCPKIT